MVTVLALGVALAVPCARLSQNALADARRVVNCIDIELALFLPSDLLLQQFLLQLNLAQLLFQFIVPIGCRTVLELEGGLQRCLLAPGL